VELFTTHRKNRKKKKRKRKKTFLLNMASIEAWAHTKASDTYLKTLITLLKIIIIQYMFKDA
jgi:hypothetical protein